MGGSKSNFIVQEEGPHKVGFPAVEGKSLEECEPQDVHLGLVMKNDAPDHVEEESLKYLIPDEYG